MKRAAIAVSVCLFAAGCGTQDQQAAGVQIVAPSSVAAGAAFTAQVSIVDKGGNVLPGYVGPVSLTSTDGKATLPAQFLFTSQDKGTHIFSGVALSTAGAQTLTATEGIKNLSASTTVTVAPAAAAKLQISIAAEVTSGTAVTCSVTALDASGNVATSYAGSVALTSTDPAAILSGPHAFTAADAGKLSFECTFATAGAQTLTASDGTLSATADLQVDPGAAARLAITGLATSVTAGDPQDFTVTAFDAAGNVATSYSGGVQLSSTDTAAQLAAAHVFDATDKGVHLFAGGVAFHRSGEQSVAASDGTLSAAAATQVSPAAAATLTLSLPATANAGASLDAKLSAFDRFGNLATGYRGTVDFGASDAQASVPAFYVFTAADAGKHTLAGGVSLRTVGAQTVTATDVAASLTATSQVNVLPAVASQLALSLPSTSTAGDALDATLVALDPFGNVAVNYTGTVSFSADDAQALLPARVTFTAADHGVHAFPGGVTLRTAGDRTVTATDAAGLNGHALVDVSPGAAKSFSITGLPATVVSLLPASATVTARDAFGNAATGYRGTAHFTSSDLAAALPPDAIFAAADQGAKTFTSAFTFAKAGAQSLTATDTAVATINGTANTTVAPGAAFQLKLTGLPAEVVAGASSTVTVTALDAAGNIVIGYLGTATFGSSDAKAVLPAAFTFKLGDAGVHSFPVSFQTAGSQQLTVTDGVAGGAQTTLVDPGAASRFQLSGLADPSLAGAAQSLSVTAFDAFGNIATGYRGTAHFSSTDGKASLPADYSFTAADAGVHGFGATLRTTGPQTVTAADGSITGSQSVTVSPAAMASLLVNGFPTPSTAGAAGTFKVTALDSFGNIAAGYLGTIHFTSSDTKAVLPADFTFGAADAGVHSFPATLKTATTTASISAADGAIAGSQQPIVVKAAAAQSLTLAGFPSPAVAGAQGNFSVTAFDAFGNTAVGYTGTVHFTSNDAKAVLPANYTFVAADAGVHSFAATLETSTSAASLTATDAALSGTQQPIVVKPAAAATLTVSGFPSPQTAGVPGNATVTLFDSFGNVASGYTGTVHLTSNDAKAVLPANYTFVAADAGTHSFAVTLETATSAASLTAGDGTLSGAQQPIVVRPAAAQTLRVAGFPSPATAGAAGNFTATALDAFGNVATGYAGVVQVSSNDPKAVLPAIYVFTALDAGAHSFPATLETATSSASLSVTDTVTASITGTQSPIVVNPAAASKLTVAGFPTPTTAGVAGSFSVTASDAFGNQATGYTGTVHFTSNDAQAALPAIYTFVAADAGAHSFPATLKTAASVASLTAADASLSGTQAPIVVKPAAAASLAVSAFPSPATAGVAGSFTVTALDAFGNVAAGYTNSVHFTSNDAKAILPASYTFVAADAGIHIFVATLETATSTASLTAADATLSGTQQPILVKPAAAQSLRVAGFPSPVTSGAAGTFTVTALDAFANVATGYLGIVRLTSNDAQATLPPDFTFTAANAGVHSFPATLATVSNAASLTATDLVTATITGTQQPIVVKPAGAATLVVSGYPSPHAAGAPGTFNVTAFDAQGNIASGYLGTIHFTSSDPGAVLPASYTFLAADGGSRDFSATFALATGNASLTATDTALPTITGKQQPLVITPGNASSLVVAGFPTPSTAGAAGTFTVTALDDFGNVATGYTGAIHFTSNDAKAVLPGNFTYSAADAGLHFFSATLKTATLTASLTATDTVVAAIHGAQQPIVVNAAAAAALTLSGFPTPQTAGVAGNFAVTALDAFGNTAVGYTGTVHLTSNDVKAVLPANFTFTVADAGTHSFAATLKTATGAASLTATDAVTATITGTQQPIVVNAGAAATLAVTGFPTPQAAGIANSFAVTAFDAFGNTAVGYTGTVHFTSNDAQAVLPANFAFTAANAGTHSFAATLQTATSVASLTATDTATAAITGTQQPIVVTPATAKSLTVSGFPSPQTAGVPGTFAVTAFDNFGNVATGYAGTVHFTSSDAKAVLPANLTFTALDAGTHSFAATLKTASVTASLSATDTVTASITGTQQPIVVNPAAVASLNVNGFPSPQTAGAAGSFSVTALDAFGNVATGFTGAVHFTSNDLKAVLPADFTFGAPDAGAHSFSATLKTAASAASLTATAGIISGTQTPIVVTPAAASTLTLSGFPAAQIAGVAGNFGVTAFDAFGNVATGYAGTVHFTSNDAKAVLPANYTFIAADAGAHSFSATLKTATLTASLTATDTVTATITGTQQPIAVTPAPAQLLTLSGFPSPSIAGVQGNFTVTAFDAFANIATGYSGTVHFSSSDAKGILPANLTFTAADAGTHAFSATLLTAAPSASLTATDTASASITGTQSPIVVNPAAASKLTVAGFPSPSTAGAPGSFSVTAFDPFGNLAKGYTGTIHLSSNDARAVLPANFTFTAGDAGAHSFSATLETASLVASLTATDTATAPITGTQAPIVVRPAAASLLTLGGFPSPQTANVPGAFSVAAFDAFGNQATGYTGTIHLSSNDARAVLPADYTFTALDAGAHSFLATLITATNTASLTASDGTLSATQQPIVIKPASGNVLQLTGFPSPVTAGVAGNFTVTARDSVGNVAAGYTGTIHFTSNDAKAVLPANYTFVAADAGIHTFPATLKTAAALASLTATDTAAGALSGTQQPIVVNPAAAATLTVSGFPSPSIAGVPGAFSVTALDAFGNIAAGYTGAVHFTSNDAQATLPASFTFTAANAGVRAFAATLKTATNAASLTATDTVTAAITGTQAPIVVTPAGASLLTVAGFPSPTTAGVSGNFNVTAFDPFGNVATGYTGLVRFSSNDLKAVLPANFAFTALDAGVHSFAAILKTTAAAASLSATDTVTASITGTQQPIVVRPAAAQTLAVAGFPSPITAGVAGNFTVTSLDAFGNIATGYLGTIFFTTPSDNGATVPANYKFLASDAGVHSFSATLRTATNASSLAAIDTLTATITGVQQPIVVNPAAAATLSVSGFPSPQVAGVPGTFGVTAHDAFGNVATGYGGTVHFTSSDAKGVLPANFTFTALDAGAHTFSATLKTASGVASLTATDTAVATITGLQFPIVVTVGGTPSLTLSGFPSPQAAGVSGTFTVAAFDAFGNPATNYLGTVHFTSNDSKATLPADFTFSAADLGTRNFSATFQTANNFASLTVTDLGTPSITAVQQPIVIKGAAAKTLTVSGFPSPQTAGVSGNFTVTAFDTFGNVASGYTGTVRLGSNDTSATLPANFTFTVGDAGTHTFSAILNVANTAASISAQDIASAPLGAVQSPIVITPAAAARLTVSGFPTPQTAGVSSIFGVKAIDTFGNTATSYAGTIHFTSNDAAAVLPANYTFVATDNGARTFVATLKTANTGASLSAADTVTAGITGSQLPIVVTPAAAASFLVSGFPSPQIAGVAGNFSVRALDAFANLATSYNGTVRFNSSDAAAVLPASYTFLAGDAGVHNFSATLKTATNSASLTATDAVATTITGTQSPIVVKAGAAASYTVSGFPSPTTAGVAGNFTVRAVDLFGNVAAGYLGTAHFTSTDSIATLPASYTFVAADAGVHTFPATLKTAGLDSIVATDTVTASITGTESVAVNPGSATTLKVSGLETGIFAGISQNVLLTAVDQFGNRATGYTGTVQFTSNDPNAVLPANLTFTTALAGITNFPITFKLATTTASLTATDTVTPSITGTESPITVRANVAKSITVTGFPSPQVSSVPGTFTIQAFDAFGNTAVSFNETIVFQSNDQSATMPAPYTFSGSDLGVHTFTATLRRATTSASILATDLLPQGLTGTQQPIVITSGPSVALKVSGFPSPTASGIAANATVKALDTSGNVATGYRGTVHFTSNDTNSSLPADFTFTAADAGAHAFPATLRTVTTTGSLTATDTVTPAMTSTQSPITITPSTPATLVVSGFTSPHVAGLAGTVTVKVLDQFGNLATNYTGTLKLTSFDPQAVLPPNFTFTAADAGVHVFTVTLKTATTSGNITATDIAVATINNSQAPIVVTPGPAQALLVSGFPSPTVAGTAGTLTVQALDAFGNTATGYTGTVHVTSNDAAAVLPANFTFAGLDAGVHLFSVALKTATTTASLTATDTVTASIAGAQSPIVVTPAAAASLTVAGFPSPVVAGSAGSFTVKAADAFGNAATGYAGTVHFTSNDAQAALPVNYTFVAGDAGSHSFSATLKTTSAAASLTAGDGTLSGTQSPIVVNPGAAKTLTVSGFPSPAAAGTAGNVSVKAVDSFGNTATGYLGTVKLTSNDAKAVLPANYTFVAADAGNHLLAVTLGTVTTTASITATDTVTASITGTQSPIVVIAGPAKTFVVSGFPNPATAGVSGNVSIKAFDQFGNIATGYLGTVKVTSSDANAVLPGNYTFVAADAGAHLLPVTLVTVTVPGQTFASITATDTVTATLTGSQTGIVVVAGPAVSLTVSGFPNPATAGVAGNLTVFARDAFGNVAGSYRGAVHFTSSDARATLPANYTFVAGDGGAHSFVATLVVAGTQTLVATDTVTVSITGQQTVTVNPATLDVKSSSMSCTPARILADGLQTAACTATFSDIFGNKLAGAPVAWSATCFNFNTGSGNAACTSTIFGGAVTGTLDSNGSASNTFAATSVQDATIAATAGGGSLTRVVISMPTQVAHGFASFDALNLTTANSTLQIVVSLANFADLIQDQVTLAPTTGAINQPALERFVAAGGNTSSVAAGFNTHDMWVSANSSTNNLTLYQPTVGVAAGSGSVSTSLITAGAFPIDVAVGDVTGDGVQDIVVANRDDNTVDVYFGSSAGTFAATPSLTFNTGVRPRGIALSALPNGQKVIAVANEGSDTISVIEPTCPFIGRRCIWTDIGTTIALPAGSHPMGIAAHTFSAAMQLSVAEAGRDQMQIFSVANGNVVTNTQNLGTGLVPTSVVYGTYNNGSVMLAVGATLGQQTNVYSVDANGLFAFATTYTQTFQQGPVILGDANFNCGAEVYVSTVDGFANPVFAGEPFTSFCPIF